SRLRRFLGQDGFDEHLRLHLVDCLSSHGGLDNYEFCRLKLAEYAAETPLPRPLVTGDDLISLGHAPGPELGRMLREIFDLQLEGRYPSRESALEDARRRYPPPGSRTPSP